MSQNLNADKLEVFVKMFHKNECHDEPEAKNLWVTRQSRATEGMAKRYLSTSCKLAPAFGRNGTTNKTINRNSMDKMCRMDLAKRYNGTSCKLAPAGE
jgi:hypothetical protein